MGTITASTRENWTDATGTVYFTGDSTYRGDVALIEMFSGKSGGASIYSGADNTAWGQWNAIQLTAQYPNGDPSGLSSWGMIDAGAALWR